jgi:hypothetical protein
VFDGLAGECAFFYLDDVMLLSGVCVPGGLPPLSRDCSMMYKSRAANEWFRV